ncbi:hypothetical protein ABT063_03975 [Streptomyces sp. NPDC002838]
MPPGVAGAASGAMGAERYGGVDGERAEALDQGHRGIGERGRFGA